MWARTHFLLKDAMWNLVNIKDLPRLLTCVSVFPVAFLGHAVGETNEDLKALIGAVSEFPNPGFLLPIRNGELFRWCLDRGLRVVQTNTLMSIGLYNTPMGACLPSILY
jgi:hypothetical protein